MLMISTGQSQRASRKRKVAVRLALAKRHATAVPGFLVGKAPGQLNAHYPDDSLPSQPKSTAWSGAVSYVRDRKELIASKLKSQLGWLLVRWVESGSWWASAHTYSQVGMSPTLSIAHLQHSTSELEVVPGCNRHFDTINVHPPSSTNIAIPSAASSRPL